MTKKSKEVFIESVTKTRNEISFTHIGHIKKHLGYDTMVVFYRFYIDGSKHPREEYRIGLYKKNAEEEIEKRLKKLNKYKRYRFWEVSALVELNKEGFNKIFNEATTKELKMMQMELAYHLGAENYMKVLYHVNRFNFCPSITKD